MKPILMIAYHFPPLAGSSGIQRTLRFVQHLPTLGWQPLVVTAHPRAYERTIDDLDGDVPVGTPVRRAFALDAGRHLSLGGRYVGATARPDRWVSWRFDAVRQGMRLIREYKPRVIWSTYPIATAHLIGAELQRRSGLPWVADFRDPMAQEGYPADPQTWQQYRAIEEHALLHAACSTFTTPGAAAAYRRRYPAAAARVQVLENGYDEASFAGAERAMPLREALNPGALTFLHSGIVYPQERDPAPLFQAVRSLIDARLLRAEEIKLRFRAAVHDGLLQSLAWAHGIDGMVQLCPPLPYAHALQEMLRADALLVMQSNDCNEQIPAKLYEYLRAGRPTFGLCDPAGDTAAALRAAGLTDIAPLESAPAIAPALNEFIGSLRAGKARQPQRDAVDRASREQRSAQFVNLLNDIAR